MKLNEMKNMHSPEILVALFASFQFTVYMQGLNSRSEAVAMIIQGKCPMLRAVSIYSLACLLVPLFAVDCELYF